MLNALQPWVVLRAELGQEHTVPKTNGVQECVYFTSELYNAGVDVNSVVTRELNDNTHLAIIADWFYRGNVNSAQVQQDTWVNTMLKTKFLMKSYVQYTLRNQSTEGEEIVAYYCKPRGNITENVSSGITNLYNWLSIGFANNGLDYANITPSTNVYMKEGKMTPFNAYDFVRDFHIYKVKKLKIAPSESVNLSIRCKSFMWRPADLFEVKGSTSATTWVGCAQKFAYNKYSRFIMFQLKSRPAGWGITQATYSKNIQMTTPTVIMHSTFKYSVKSLIQLPQNYVNIELGGIGDNSASAPPAIIVPDGDLVGGETDAI